MTSRGYKSQGLIFLILGIIAPYVQEKQVWAFHQEPIPKAKKSEWAAHAEGLILSFWYFLPIAYFSASGYTSGFMSHCIPLSFTYSQQGDF